MAPRLKLGLRLVTSQGVASSFTLRLLQTQLTSYQEKKVELTGNIVFGVCTSFVGCDLQNMFRNRQIFHK